MAKSIKGAESLKRKLNNLEKKGREKVKDALNSSAFAIDKDIKNSLQTPSQGRTYGNHTASKPGEAPNTDTGELVASVFIERATTNKLIAKVGADAQYTKDLEYGTSKMAARPFIQPAFDKNKDKIVKDIKVAIGKELRK